MFPSDEWLLVLNFYLIVCSGGKLTTDDFSDETLYLAWLEQPEVTYPALVPVAEKLVLVFEAKEKDTEPKYISPIGESEEYPVALYQYQCSECEATFEKFVNAEKRDQVQLCPNGHLKGRRLLSAVKFQMEDRRKSFRKAMSTTPGKHFT